MVDVHYWARQSQKGSVVAKATYDEKLFCQTYQTGDLDTQIKAGLSKKLKPIYTGPLIVVEMLSPVTYRVAGCKKTKVLHHDLL